MLETTRMVSANGLCHPACLPMKIASSQYGPHVWRWEELWVAACLGFTAFRASISIGVRHSACLPPHWVAGPPKLILQARGQSDRCLWLVPRKQTRRIPPSSVQQIHGKHPLGHLFPCFRIEFVKSVVGVCLDPSLMGFSFHSPSLSRAPSI